MKGAAHLLDNLPDSALYESPDAGPVQFHPMSVHQHKENIPDASENGVGQVRTF